MVNTYAVRKTAIQVDSELYLPSGATLLVDATTVTVAELGILAGVTATAAELNYNDITLLGTTQASKTWTTDSSANTAHVGTLTLTDGVASGDARRVGGRVSVRTSAGTAHTNSTDEAVLSSYTIPANTIKAGTIIKLRYQGIATVDNGATTLTVRVRLGATTLTGTALVTTGAVDISANHIFQGEVTIVGRAAPGAAAAVVACAWYTDPVADAGALKVTSLGSTNFATNAALLLELTADWSAADSNSCRCDIFNVEIVG